MTFIRPDFPRTVIDAAKAHALQEYPKESCGLVINNVYIPYENVAEDPLKAFEFAASVKEDLVACTAIIHSHPDGNDFPSKTDMQGQIDTDRIWGIIKCTATVAKDPVFWGDFMLEEPLIGRSFIPGVSDCYALARAYFWQTKKIKLLEVARDPEWWESGDNLYVDLFTEAGFKTITMSEAVEGDCFIGKVLSEVSNHGGIILNKGLALHILSKRLSRREPIGPWLKYVTHWLRYVGNDANG